MTRGVALQARLSQHLSSIAIARYRTLESTDPEGLHDLRVAIRGLRAVLPLLGKKATLLGLRTRWRMLAQSTNTCRDLEVLLELLSLFPDVPDAVRTRLTMAEHEARRQLCLMLVSAEMPLLLQQSRKVLNHLLVHQTARAIHQRAQRRAIKLTRFIYQQILDLGRNPVPKDWHALRLTIKRLRYLIEHGENWLPEHWRSLYPILKQSQTALGELHDMDMLAEQIKLDLGALHDVRRTAARTAVASLADCIGACEVNRKRRSADSA